MAYSEQTSIAHPADLIDRLATFAASNGWTVHRNNLVVDNRTITLSKGGSDYIHVYNTDAEFVRQRISIDYNGSLSPAAQDKVSQENQCSLQEGPYPRAFLFADANHVWVTVAIARTGEYRHLTFGVLDKIGDYTGGTYIDGTTWGRSNRWGDYRLNHAPFLNYTDGWPTSVRGAVRADVPADLREDFYFYIHGVTTVPNPTRLVSDISLQPNDGLASTLVERADRNAFSGRSIFHAIPLYVARTGSETYYSPIGVVHDVRFCSLNKFEPEQEVTIALDTYKVFPVAGKRPMNSNTGDQPAASGDFGYAIRKVL